jgi:TPR repeat protein
MTAPKVLLLLVAACGSSPRQLVNTDEPKQTSDQGALTQKGARSFEQRQTDCWDMPSAEACYEVGMGYELGLYGERDAKTARQYYQKACELERQPEHCNAARRMKR